MRNLISLASFASMILFASLAYGQDSIQLNDERLPDCLKAEGWQVVVEGQQIPTEPIVVDTENRYVPKVIVTGNGRVVFSALVLEVTLADGSTEVVVEQRWGNNKPVAGGHWSNTQSWFGDVIAIDRGLDIFEVTEEGNLIVDTSTRPDEVVCFWTTRWPHPDIPDDAVQVTIRVEVEAVEGDVLWQIGLDRYKSRGITQPRSNVNVWQDVLSPLKGQEHGSGTHTLSYPVTQE